MNGQDRDWPRLVVSLAAISGIFGLLVFTCIALAGAGQTNLPNQTAPLGSSDCGPVLNGVGRADDMVMLQVGEKFTSAAVVLNDEQYEAVAEQLESSEARGIYSLTPSMSAQYCQVESLLLPSQRAELERLDHFEASRSRFYFTTTNPTEGVDGS